MALPLAATHLHNKMGCEGRDQNTMLRKLMRNRNTQDAGKRQRTVTTSAHRSTLAKDFGLNPIIQKSAHHLYIKVKTQLKDNTSRSIIYN
eukprot:2429135-Amphidinium_carterae.1